MHCNNWIIEKKINIKESVKIYPLSEKHCFVDLSYKREQKINTYTEN